MNIRIAIAIDVAAEIGAIVTEARCPDCGAPLLEKEDQNLAFCWLCVTDRIAAQRGRDALTKARLAEKGIIVEHHHTMAEPDRPEEEHYGPLKFGMPL